MLLILDNCEHVIADAAAVADALLGACRQLRILATSREPLRVPGERTYRLPPLRVPTSRESRVLSAAASATYPALLLFNERAQTIDHRFVLRDNDVAIVADICRRLDGIPLAIELAAARTSMFSVQTLQRALDDRFRTLTNGNRTALPRHQTIRALIDWSYDLLAPPEQRLFERLSIFAGGCDPAAGAAVCGDAADEFDVLELLSSLVDKSLVVADLSAGEARYRLPETTRRYAHEKLSARGDAAILAHRHARTYADLAERLEQQYDAVSDSAWLARAELELENWRTALAWTLGDRGDIALGRRLAGAMAPIWTNFSCAEGRRWTSAALDLTAGETSVDIAARLEYVAARIAYWFLEYEATLTTSRRLIRTFEQSGDALRAARARFLAGASLVWMGRIAEGEPLLQSALESARSLGNIRVIGLALGVIGYARSLVGDISEARDRIGDSISTWRSIGSERNAAYASVLLADVEFVAGNTGRALELTTEGLGALRERGSIELMTIALLNLTTYLIACDRWSEARAHAVEAIDLAQESGRFALLSPAFAHLAAVAALSLGGSSSGSSGSRTAARLLGYLGAHADVARITSSSSEAEKQENERVRCTLRAAFGSDRLALLTAEGAAMTQDQAIAAARSIEI
jgi:predicted ATPase